MPSFTPGTTHKYSFPATTIAINANEPTQVAFGNPRRIALGLFSLDSNMVIFPTSTGVMFSQISPALATSGGYWYLASESGPLCQIDWYAYTSSGGSVTVIEVVEES